MGSLSRRIEAGAWSTQVPAEQLGELADSLHEGLQVLDRDFRYLFLNDVAACEHGKASKDALLGRTLMECYEGVADTPLFAELSRCMRERVRSSFDHCFRYPDGTTRWFSLRIEPVPQGLAVFSLDVEEHKRLQEEVHRSRAHQAAGRAAGGVVHDLNNLLTVVMAACDLLDRDPLPEAAVVRAELDHIRSASERGAELIRRLRREARAERIARLEVNDALRGVVPLLRTLTGASVQLGIHLDPAVGAVQMDPVEFERVMVNLVTNARDAVAAGGHVWLSTALVDAARPGEEPPAGQPGPLVRIRVADDGCGMDAATRAQIFEAFFSTKGAEQGAGLGLPTSHDLVARARGRITVKSRPGSGTTFDVWLPAVTEPVQPTTPPPPPG